MIYFLVVVAQLNESKSTKTDRVGNAIIGILVSAFILLLDFLAINVIDRFVSFEVHFSSVGRNWKRIAYLSAFIIFNILAVILAYCSAQPVSMKLGGNRLQLDTVFSVEEWKQATYQASYAKWLQLCSRAPYRPALDVISDLRKISSNLDVQNTIGFWHHFTSKSVDDHVIPAFAVFENDKDANEFTFISVGCHSYLNKTKFLCEGIDKKYDYVDSCDFISNISNFYLADESIPSILFGAAMYAMPWSNSSTEFRLSSFAEEGSLYGFLFAFIFIKGFRMVLFYIYNDLVSIISHRLLLPLFKRLGHDTKVSLKVICILNHKNRKQQHHD
jgi:hypothetical protein